MARMQAITLLSSGGGAISWQLARPLALPAYVETLVLWLSHWSELTGATPEISSRTKLSLVS